MIQSKSLLTPREAADVLNISPKTLYLRTSPRGSIPCLKIGSRIVRYDPDSLQEWIERQQQKGAK